MLKEAAVEDENPIWALRTIKIPRKESGSSTTKLLEKWRIHIYVQKVLEQRKITRLFPVQETLIPYLQGRPSRDAFSIRGTDLIVTAPTGQGKTLAYLIPIISDIFKHRLRGPSALIIAPSRELVMQIYDVTQWFVNEDVAFSQLYHFEKLNNVALCGKYNMAEANEKLMKQRPHILIATPGRFVEHFDHLLPRYYKFVLWIVIDEGDFLLSQPCQKWAMLLNKIAKKIGQRKSDNPITFRFANFTPQKVVISATIPKRAMELNLLQFRHPVLMKSHGQIYRVPDQLKQFAISCKSRQRLTVVIKVLHRIFSNENETGNLLIFCSSRNTGHHVYRYIGLYLHKCPLEISVHEFTSRVGQRHRDAAIEAIYNSKRVCCVCSDLLARGLNLTTIKNVFNFDLPKNISMYIHRIGRTARALDSGRSYVILTQKTEKRFEKYKRQLGVDPTNVGYLHAEEIVEESLGKQIDAECALIDKMVNWLLALELNGKIKSNAPVSRIYDSLVKS